MVEPRRRRVIRAGIGLVAAGALNPAVQGAGLADRKQRLAAFSQVFVDLPARVTIEPGPGFEVTIRAESQVLDKIRAAVANDKLVLEASASFSTEQAIEVQVRCGPLRQLVVHGASTVSLRGPTEPALRILLEGSSEVTLTELNLDSLDLDIRDSSQVSASGRSKRQSVSLSGAAGYGGESLQTGSTTISVTDSGEATVSAAEKLQANVSGAGSVLYRGRPALTTNISDAGSVERI